MTTRGNDWFRGANSDDSDSDSTDSSSSSSGSTDSTHSSSDSSSTRDSKAPPVNWMRKDGPDDDSDSSDDKKKKVQSKRTKADEALIEAKKKIESNITSRDYSRLLDNLEHSIEINTSVMRSGGGVHNEFIACVRLLQRFFAELDVKEAKKSLKNKLVVKALSKLQSKTNKTIKEYQDAIDKYESEEETEEESDSSLSEVDHDEEALQRRPKRRQRENKKKEETKEDKDEWTEEGIERKLADVMGERGKKNTKNTKLVEKLKVILGHTGQWQHLTLYVLSVMLSCQLDKDSTMQLSLCMTPHVWKSCYDILTRMMNIIQDSSIIAIDQDDEEKRNERLTKTSELKGAFEQENGKYKVYLTCSIHQVVDILGDEYTKSLQFSDPHAHEYVTRLTDECYLVDLTERVFCYYKTQPVNSAGKRTKAANMAVRLMDVLYYRRKEDHAKMTEKQRDLTYRKHPKKGEEGSEEPIVEEEDEEKVSKEKQEERAKSRAEKMIDQLDQRSKNQKYMLVHNDLEDVVRQLHAFVYKHLSTKEPASIRGEAIRGDAPTEERNVTKALLYYIYHLSIHDRYHKARDMLIMSRRYAEHEDHSKFVSSTPLMVLYNRVIAQLGLASFRAGEFEHTNLVLNDLAYNRTRESLAQSLVKNREKSEPDRNEKTKLVPFHMHINVDMIDGMHLTAAVLREVPIRAQYPHDIKRRPQSKSFNRLMMMFSQQVFIGPPETTKELIYAAYQSLQKGDWATTNKHIMSLNMWSSVKDADRVKAQVTEKIKVEGLRTYLYTYSQFYTTVQLGELAVKYEMEEAKVHAIVSKMILKQHITAAWDQPQQCICVEQNSVTKLQFLASQMSDKCTQLVDYNEKRQAEKEERQGNRQDGQYDRHNYNGRQRKKWDQHKVGIQKSRQTERKSHNAFERRTWKR